MTDEADLSLKKSIDECLQWMLSSGYARGTYEAYRSELNAFLRFIDQKQVDWKDIFTIDMLGEFERLEQAKTAPGVRRLFRFLFERKVIDQSLDPPKRKLPEPYEDYLGYYQRTQHMPSIRLARIRKVLCAFYDYLEKHSIKLPSIRIAQIDAFLAEFFANFSPSTRKTYRFYLRGFLRYLYYPGNIIRKDLAPLVIIPRQFAQSKPPKFFRLHEIQRLFDSLEISSAKGLRNYAMVHLSYDLGLRPDEISLITLDDVSFAQSILTLTKRKNNRPDRLPIPESTMKAIAAYIVGARPKSRHRRLLLSIVAPYRPVSPSVVGTHITECIRKAGLSGSAYWLRHTYAQNLLEAGSSVYEIKEMLGHDYIDSSEKYLHIHTKLMRRVIFDEEL